MQEQEIKLKMLGALYKVMADCCAVDLIWPNYYPDIGLRFTDLKAVNIIIQDDKEGHRKIQQLLFAWLYSCLWPSLQNSSSNFDKWKTLEVGVILSEFNVDIKNQKTWWGGTFIWELS